MKILLVNSTPSLKKAIDSSIDRSKQTLVNKDIKAIAEELKESAGRIAVINWSKADINILSVCSEIKKTKRIKFIYIIVILSRDNQKDIEKILESGADDFVFKPFGKEEFASRIKIAETRIKREDTFASSSKTLMKSVKEDSVTGLYNRRALLDEALKEMGRASRESKFISSVMATMNNYERLVSSHGNDIADEVLAEFGKRMRSSCRPYDKIGRIGISDFLILLPDAKSANAVKITDRIIKTVTSKPFITRGMNVPVNFSLGISELNPEDIARNNHVDDHLINDLLLDSLIKKAESSKKKI